MLRKICVLVITVICFLLQTTLFQAISFISVAPNLLVIVTSSYGFMRGKKEGMYVGLLCGLLIDIFYSNVLGMYTLFFVVIGYLNGFFRKIFFPEDMKLPMILIAASDMVYNFLIYFFLFLFRGRTAFDYYLTHIMIPELVYTSLIMIVLYFIILKINQRLESYEKRSASKFV